MNSMGQGAIEARVLALLDAAERHKAGGRLAEAIVSQRAAADTARELAARFPQDLRVRQGLASVLYNLASLLVSNSEYAAAIPELDDCLGQYESLTDAVPDAGLLCADVCARRGLAAARLGRAASAIVDADRAVLAYLTATEGDLDHPLGRDVARVAAVNAVVLARHGDPDLAAASADGALMYYTAAAERAFGNRLPAEDRGYLFTAACVSAMLHLAFGRLADGFYAAEVIVGNLAPEELTEPLLREMGMVQRLLARPAEIDRPVPHPEVYGNMLAGTLLPVLQDKPTLWLPPGEPGPPGEWDGIGWPGWEVGPTLEAALGRRAAGAQDTELFAEMTAGQPRELVWTASMRWPGSWISHGLRLAELAVETLPHAYADGLRLALDAHAMLAAGHRHRNEASPAAPREYVPRWRRLLTEVAAACHAAEDDALADDLVAVAAAVHE